MKCAKDHPRPAEIENYIKKVDEILAHNKIDRVFCCTDEEAVLEKIQRKYGDLLVYTSSFRSIDGTAVHKNKASGRISHKYQLGKEVLMDSLLLSKCEYLVHGYSNVTNASIVFNKNQYISTRLVEPSQYT